MKVFSLLSMAALTTSLTASGFCEEESPARIDFRESQNERIISQQSSNGYDNRQEDFSSKQMMQGQNEKRVMNSSHGCVDQGFSIEGEFIWWRAVLDNLEYAADFKADPDLDQRVLGGINGTYKFPDFKFDPGVRLSLGYDFGESNWDLFARWTYHHTDPTDSVQGTSGVFVFNEFYVFDGGRYPVVGQTARTKWENRINIGDLEMGYDYFFSDRFSFRPSFGLKAAWVKMDNHTTVTDATFERTEDNFLLVIPSFTMKSQSKWWGIGPAVGIDGHLHIGWGFSLYSRVSGALMYGAVDSKLDQTDTLGNYMRTKANNEYRQKAMAQMVIGLEWAKCFSNNILLAFNLGWEGQHWWNQNEFRYLNDSNPRGDLTLTGLDAGVRLDF